MFYVTPKIDFVNSVFMSAANRYCEMRFKNGKKNLLKMILFGEGRERIFKRYKTREIRSTKSRCVTNAP